MSLLKTAAALALLAAFALPACGGGGETTSPGGGAGSRPADTSASFTPPTHRDTPSGAAELETEGGDNSIQEFGSEASGSDFEAAAAALHGYLDARAARAWRAACSHLSPDTRGSLGDLGGGGAASCPETLASLSAEVPNEVLAEAAEADVAAMRVEGDRAFLLFRGAHDAAYFMPMAHVGGAWKVAAITASALL